MRIVYMDETGTDKSARLLIVAAAIIHADKQLEIVEDALQQIIEDHVPKNMRDQCTLHATDLFRKETKDPVLSKIDLLTRRRMLEQFLRIPKALSLPVCVSIVPKDNFEKNYSAFASKFEMLVAMHAAAIAQCTTSVEQFMRSHTVGEIAMIFAEDNNHVRAAAKETQIIMKNRDAAKLLDLATNALPLVRIKDGISFVTKKESRALQLADASAWAWHKMISKDEDALRFCNSIREQFVLRSMTTMDAAARITKDIQSRRSVDPQGLKYDALRRIIPD